MRTPILALATAVIVGMLVAGAQSFSGDPTVAPAEAFVKGGFGFSKPECPGGASPVCVVCSGIDCVAACNGDYTCDMDRNLDGDVTECRYNETACETATPSFWGWFIW